MSSRQRSRSVRMMGGAITIAALLGAGACSTSPAGTDEQAAALDPGTLLTARTLTESAALPSAGRNERITYMSEDANGEPIVVSGTVAIPAGEAPEGGWPVISWAHGTTGVADACAPSADTPDGPVHDYLASVDETLDAWVRKGFVVVQTDYEGLGTPGGHPYMNGTSEANTIVDIVRAGRQLDGSVGDNWFAMGHSQGGQAVLFTAEKGVDRAPELNLEGAVSIAPGNGTSQIPELVKTGNPIMASGVPFVPVILLGVQAVDPSVVPEDLLSDQALPLLAAARTGCLAAVRALPPVPVAEVFRPGADLTTLTENLKQQEPVTVTPKVPVLFAQGTADVLVPEAGTNALVKTLCERGSTIGYRTYEGADHRAAVGASLTDAQDFTTRMLAGEEINAGAC